MMNSKWIFILMFLIIFSGCQKEKSSYIFLGSASSSSNPLTSALLIQARYTNASNWSQYIRRSDYSTACTGAEVGVGACVHGGDKKQVILNGITSCSGLSMTDALGAFFWYCDSTTGTAIFYSSLKLDKTIGDLVDSTPDWRFNSITLSGPAFSVTTANEKWWTNVVVEAPINLGSCTPGAYYGCSVDVALLNSANVVYVVTTTRETAGYRITANNVSFATLPTIRILSRHGGNNCDYNGGGDDAYCTFDTESVSFAWVEFQGQFSNGSSDPRSGGATTFPLLVNSTKHSIFRYVKVAISNDDAIFINKSSNNIFSNFHVTNAAWAFWIDDDTNTSLTTNNIFRFNLVAHSSNEGFKVIKSPSNNYLANTAMGTFFGFWLESGDSNSTLHNFLGVGVNQSNVDIRDVTGVNVSQLALFNTGTNALAMRNFSSSKITGNLVFGNNTGLDCFEDAGGTPLSSTCTVNDGVSNPNVTTGVTALSVSSSFVGQVTSDIINGEEDGAGQMLGANYGGDWFNFQNFFRSWGPNNTFLSNGMCPSGGSCQLQDNTLALASTVIRNTTDTGSSSNGAGLVVGAACPAAVSGNKTLTHVNTTIYMKNAVEIDGDGDGDGLCESNETCLYTPNFGAYQGHGTFGQCTFSDGTITGVKMFGYETNGR